jgi:hypothetical protein
MRTKDFKPLKLKQIDKGIAALEDVQKYIQQIKDSEDPDYWNAWTEVGAEVMDRLLATSKFLRLRATNK